MAQDQCVRLPNFSLQWRRSSMDAILRPALGTDEVLLVELQSWATTEDGAPLSGRDLGILKLLDGGKATITNGPRTLHGKVVNLAKPLVLMEKTDETEEVVG